MGLKLSELPANEEVFIDAFSKKDCGESIYIRNAIKIILEVEKWKSQRHSWTI